MRAQRHLLIHLAIHVKEPEMPDPAFIHARSKNPAASGLQPSAKKPFACLQAWFGPARLTLALCTALAAGLITD
ncbi:MAG: hypothetical protein EBX72_13110, partial [Betaproteobacteria bacterium]|nr:hypothetical protein [Betaproteobacteria bacterium]